MSVFVIAEAGSNHLNDLRLALNLIDEAAGAGADAIKFQCFRSDQTIVPGPSREAMRRWELPYEWLPILKGYADGCGIEFMASAFSKETYDAVDPYVKRHKVASLEASDQRLIVHVATKGKPMIVSTGAMDGDEVEGLDYRVLPRGSFTRLHCVAAYPAPADQSNLTAMSRMLPPYGLSDHSTDPILLPVMAVALGATVIEKHMRLADTTDQSPDFPHSIDPKDFAFMVKAIRQAEAAMGDGVKRVMPSEEDLVPLKRKPGKLRGEA